MATVLVGARLDVRSAPRTSRTRRRPLTREPRCADSTCGEVTSSAFDDDHRPLPTRREGGLRCGRRSARPSGRLVARVGAPGRLRLRAPGPSARRARRRASTAETQRTAEDAVEDAGPDAHAAAVPRSRPTNGTPALARPGRRASRACAGRTVSEPTIGDRDDHDRAGARTRRSSSRRRGTCRLHREHHRQAGDEHRAPGRRRCRQPAASSVRPAAALLALAAHVEHRVVDAHRHADQQDHRTASSLGATQRG